MLTQENTHYLHCVLPKCKELTYPYANYVHFWLTCTDTKYIHAVRIHSYTVYVVCILLHLHTSMYVMYVTCILMHLRNPIVGLFYSHISRSYFTGLHISRSQVFTYLGPIDVFLH